MNVSWDNCWALSDNHWHHESMLKAFGRYDTFQTVEEMNAGMIRRWNDEVPTSGIVYFTGDMFYTAKSPEILKVLDQLNGSICLVKGNHDHFDSACKKRFQWIKDYYKLKIEDDEGIRRQIVMSHYPFLEWDGYYRGSWHIFGHTHNKRSENPDELSLNVSVENWDYTPVSFAKIKEAMKKKTKWELYNEVDC